MMRASEHGDGGTGSVQRFATSLLWDPFATLAKGSVSFADACDGHVRIWCELTLLAVNAAMHTLYSHIERQTIILLILQSLKFESLTSITFG
jgi:hypothetical protein